MARKNYNIGLTGTDVLIPGSFIARHLASTPGEHIKVFILLLRAAQEGRPFDTSLAADILETTEKSVERSLQYLEGQGLISASGSFTAPVTEDAFEESEESVSEIGPATEDIPAEAPMPEKDPDRYKIILTPDLLAEVENDPRFKELTHILQAYSNKVVSHSDYEHLIRFYYRMDKNLDICELILAHCADSKKLTMKNVDKTSIELLDKGCRTADTVKYYLDRSEIGKEIIDVIGLNMKKLSGAHQDEVDKWFLEYNSPKELVLEASRKAVLKAGSSNCINLIGSILKDWSDRGIDTLEAVHADDKLFKEAQEKKYGKKGPAAGNAGENSANKFNRFEQRETNFSEDEALFMSKHRKKKSEAASDAGNT